LLKSVKYGNQNHEILFRTSEDKFVTDAKKEAGVYIANVYIALY